MRDQGLDIVAPAIVGGGYGEAEAFGAATWLWMHSAAHHDVPLQLLSVLLLPALKCGQFVLASENGKPVFYLSWSRFDADAEARYLANPPQCMPVADWTSGDRLWFLDWIAPFGHTRQMRSLLARRLFAGACARALHHRGDAIGLRVLHFRGSAVTSAEARRWFAQHPLPPCPSPPDAR